MQTLEKTITVPNILNGQTALSIVCSLKKLRNFGNKFCDILGISSAIRSSDSSLCKQRIRSEQEM